MATDQNLKCVIIGEGTLPIVCSQILRERGHRVLALASPDARVTRWGQANGIAHAATPSGLASLIEGDPFDCLFSVVNFQKVPDCLLEAASRYAVNYHDGPLPRYAGTHATSWALLNGETRYAVTWHVMTRRTDAGDILKQIPVDIDSDDTAFSLNAKCYEAAVSGFRALLDDMQAHAVDRCPQDPLQRTFFRRDQRPAAGCTLPFETSAEYLHALLRALDFGPYPNPMGLPKIALGESFAIVTDLEVLDGRSGALPGTIVGITAEQLVVATASDDVSLAGFFTIDGAPMSMTGVAELGQLRIGDRMSAVAEDRAARLDALYARLSRHEPFWMTQLTRARPSVLPYPLHAAGRPPRIARHGVALDPQALTAAADDRAGDRLLAAFVVYLARLTDVAIVDIGFSETPLHADIGDLHPFFSTCLPLHAVVDHEESFDQFAHVLKTQLEQVRAHRSYARDAPLRDPALRARFDAADTSAWPICVEMLDCIDAAPIEPLPAGRVLVVRLGSDGRGCALLHDPDVLDTVAVEGIARQFAALLRLLGTRAAQPLRTLSEEVLAL